MTIQTKTYKDTRLKNKEDEKESREKWCIYIYIYLVHIFILLYICIHMKSDLLQLWNKYIIIILTETSSVRQLLTSSRFQMTWYASGRCLKSLSLKKKRAPPVRKKRSRNSCVLFPTENGLCVPRTQVIVFPTRMADGSSLLRLLPVVSWMTLVQQKRASCAIRGR